jgi:hypothetical protein
VPSDDFADWANAALSRVSDLCAAELAAAVVSEKFGSLRDLMDFLSKGALNPWAFEASGLIDGATPLLKGHDRSVPISVTALRQVCLDLLKAAPIPQGENLWPNRSAESMADCSLKYHVSCEGRMHENVSFSFCSPFLAIEAWYNKEQRGIGAPAIAATVLGISEVRVQNLSFAEMGFLHRPLARPGISATTSCSTASHAPLMIPRISSISRPSRIKRVTNPTSQS